MPRPAFMRRLLILRRAWSAILTVGTFITGAAGCSVNRPNLAVRSDAPQSESLIPAGVEQYQTLAADEGWRTPLRAVESSGPATLVGAAAGAQQNESATIQLTQGTLTAPVPPAPAATSPTANTSADATIVPMEEATSTFLPTDGGRPIDLGTSLALVAGQNPSVNFARAQIREAYAQLDAAGYLILPTLQAGVSYNHHEGQLQDVGGDVRNINRSALNTGFGAGAVGAGTVPAPGLLVNFHAADAIFGPEIARRAAWASRHAADAEVNDQLLATAEAYLELLRACQLRSIAAETLVNSEDLGRVTADFSESGQGLQADADRSSTELALRRNELLRAEEAVIVASARLAELLRLDPTCPLLPLEYVVLPLELAGPPCDSRDMVSTALRHRPELRQQQALVEAACEALKREKYAPLVPSLLVGASYSGFGGGVGDDINNFSDRADYDARAVWQVRNLGFGEQAARGEASARIDQARFRQAQTMDRVAREVVESNAQVELRGRQVAIAAAAVRSAENSYALNRDRIREGQGLPIETLQAVQALDVARREYVRTVTDYNVAQFRLHRALGWPVRS